jgi:hypothetical protein
MGYLSLSDDEVSEVIRSVAHEWHSAVPDTAASMRALALHTGRGPLVAKPRTENRLTRVVSRNRKRRKVSGLRRLHLMRG